MKPRFAEENERERKKEKKKTTQQQQNNKTPKMNATFSVERCHLTHTTQTHHVIRNSIEY